MLTIIKDLLTVLNSGKLPIQEISYYSHDEGSIVVHGNLGRTIEFHVGFKVLDRRTVGRLSVGFSVCGYNTTKVLTFKKNQPEEEQEIFDLAISLWRRLPSDGEHINGFEVENEDVQKEIIRASLKKLLA